MRIGDRVTYLTVSGDREGALVTAVPGSGASGWKTLTLRLDDGSDVSDVAHQGDANDGDGCWVFPEDVSPAQAIVDALPIESAEIIAPAWPVEEATEEVAEQ